MPQETVDLPPAPSWVWRVAIAIALLMLLVLAVLVANALGPYLLGMDKSRVQASATYTLQRLPPHAYDSSGHFLGVSSFTAERLNRMSNDRVRDLTFVSADEPSTGPKVVSVNPIDDYTWGAAALSARSGVCYLTLLAVDPENPRLGGFKRGWLPRGSRCVGEAATKVTVRNMNWPTPEELNS